MSDPRVETVLAVLREAGATTNFDDTDTLATKIVNALDREHGTGEAEAGADGDPVARTAELAATPPGNPETPAGTSTEGGSGDNS